MVKKQLEEDIKTILNYLWKDEQNHYQQNPSKNHIYTVLRRLAKRIKYSY